MELEDWFTTLWHDYAALAPRVSGIRALLDERGEMVVDDHVAFRTLNIAPIDLDRLGLVIETLGYAPFDDYAFPEKKLRARSYVHPEGWPRIFLSELLVEELAADHQQILRDAVAELSDFEIGPETFFAGRPWAAPSHDSYLKLQEVSEYAAWVLALGLRPNHFTVNLNDLDSFQTLERLLDWVAQQGFALNESGGRVKGSPEVRLTQGSTLADRLEVEFSDGKFTVPTCYYEFALRYPNDNGTLYEGFVATSADRIFESTDAKRES